jgi:COP9 signalosome complex subunit 1
MLLSVTFEFFKCVVALHRVSVRCWHMLCSSCSVLLRRWFSVNVIPDCCAIQHPITSQRPPPFLFFFFPSNYRQAYSQLGDLYFRRGDMTEAFRQHIRTRDYSTAPLHVLRMCLAVVRCALAMSNYLHVHTYVAKAEGLGADEAHAADDLALPRLRCASGLAQLAGGRYRQAAKAFTSLPAEIGDAAGRLGDVACGADVATYGALCALASFDRAELGSSVIENASFRDLLASAPGEVNEAVTAFYGARYGDALAALARVRPGLTLDPYVSGHLDALLKAARARALTQYSAPFATLDLRGMARAFETDVE